MVGHRTAGDAAAVDALTTTWFSRAFVTLHNTQGVPEMVEGGIVCSKHSSVYRAVQMINTPLEKRIEVDVGNGTKVASILDCVLIRNLDDGVSLCKLDDQKRVFKDALHYIASDRYKGPAIMGRPSLGSCLRWEVPAGNAEFVVEPMRFMSRAALVADGPNVHNSVMHACSQGELAGSFMLCKDNYFVWTFQNDNYNKDSPGEAEILCAMNCFKYFLHDADAPDIDISTVRVVTYNPETSVVYAVHSKTSLPHGKSRRRS